MNSLKHAVIFITTAALLLLCASTSLCAQSGSKAKAPLLKKQAMPFLIIGKLPHLTGILMKQWDNPRLGLTEKQKRWLMVVRKETIADVMRLAKKVSALEKQVVEGINSGKEPDELYPLVKQIAKLKTEATMVHLKCIYDTRKILTPEQMQWLMNQWKATASKPQE